MTESYPCPHPECEHEATDTTAISLHTRGAHDENYTDMVIATEYGQIPEEFLSEQYYNEGKTMMEIGEMVGVSYGTISRRMEHYGLDRGYNAGGSSGDGGFPDSPGPVERLRRKREAMKRGPETEHDGDE